MMQKGQSLIELMVAMAVFVLVASAVVFLVIDAYVSDRAGQEITKATFLAEEGLEQARLVRDTNWDDLVSASPETIGKFTRTVTVEDIDSERKRVICDVNWDLTEIRPQSVRLITYLTNWQSQTLDCNAACIEAGFTLGRCRNLKACKGTVIGLEGGYGCKSKRACCCE